MWLWVRKESIDGALSQCESSEITHWTCGWILTVYLAITDECVSCLVIASWPHGSYVCAVSDTPWQSR